MRRRLIQLAGTGALLVAALWLWRLSAQDSATSFLPRHGPAEWLVYPKPTVPYLQGVAELPTSFRRAFTLSQVPSTATLSVRACRRCVISINGRNIVLVPAALNWKEPQLVAVGPNLRAGGNSIVVTAFNHLGPPALWLSLTGPGLNIYSDSSWEASYAGAVWRPARLASQPAPQGFGNPLTGAELTIPAVAHRWRFLAVIFLLSSAAVGGGVWWFTQNATARESLAPKWRWLASPPVILVGCIAALWVTLFTHNLGLVPRSAGFDSLGHLEYIRYIQHHRALPFADQGWEMHQPPFYYLLGAGVLNCLRLTTSSFDGVAVLRLLSLAVGLTQIGIVFSSLRLLFPKAISSQTLGLCLAGFLPMQLYLTQYVTNETLAACLMSATLYLSLKLVVRAQSSWHLYAALGLCLGLALLAKVTTLVIVPFVLAALAYAAFRNTALPAERLVVDTIPGKTPCPNAPLAPATRRSRRWTLPLLSIALSIAVCGWHYWRVWRHFGHAFFVPTQWAYGVTWWQDPGFHTGAYFTHFGRALSAPFFSGISSFADGLYTTLWGDGLCGGASAILYRPPWNYEIMAAGFLLALLPTALILIGAARTIVKLLREPDPAWLGLLGFGFALLLAIIHLNLQVPAYAEAKAAFGLAALIPLCALAACGWNFIRPRLGRFAAIVGVLVGCWALTSYASFWVRGDAATTRALLGRALMNEGNFSGAAGLLKSALDINPQHIAARSFLVSTLLKQNRLNEAAHVAEDGVREHPDSALCRLDLATVLEKRADVSAALTESQLAVGLAPDNPDARLKLASLLFKQHHHPETIMACREALRLTPADPEVHFLLASSLLAVARQPTASLALSGCETLSCGPSGSWSPGDILAGESVNHFQDMLRLAPDTPDALNSLAWTLATYPRTELRNGPEAVRLAQRACALTDNKNPSQLATLAAAYAETGQFQSAVEYARRAETLATTSKNEALQRLIHHLVTLFSEQHPYRQLPAGAQ